MPFFLVDDDFAFHPKVSQAGDPAIGLWTRAGAYCMKYLTDGFVSREALRDLRAKPAQVQALVKARLWVEVPGGYLFHEFLDRNPSRAEVEDKRAKRAAAGRVGGRRSGQTQREKATDSEANAEAFASPMLRPGANPQAQAQAQAQYLLTLVSRLAAGDAGASMPPPAEVIAAWQDEAGPAVDLDVEAKRYLQRFGDRPANDERGAWLGWLRAARRRADAVTTPAAPAATAAGRPPCTTPGCVGGWLPEHPDTGLRPPCPACKPHLTVVPNTPAVEAS